MLRLSWSVFAATLAVCAPIAAWADLSPEAGSFVFQTFSAKQYSGLPNNWAVVQDQRGVMYFGNTNGVLEYAGGADWRHIRAAKPMTVRALAVAADGTVFNGGDGNFGYLKPDASGAMQFESLLDRLPAADRHFGEIWNVLSAPDGVYFQCNAYLFRYSKDKKITVWKARDSFQGAFQALGDVYVLDGKYGFKKVQHDRLVTGPGRQHFPDDHVSAALTIGESSYIASPRRLYRMYGSYILPFPTQADQYFEENQIYSLGRLTSGSILVGTRRGGLVVLNSRGELSRVVQKKDGLPSDFVTAALTDRFNGVWLTTDIGIARFDPALTKYADGQGLQGIVSSIGRIGGNLYAGTRSGLFRMQSSPSGGPDFQAVEGISKTVWNIVDRGDLALIASTNGVFTMEHSQVKQILDTNNDTIYDVELSPRDTKTAYAAGRSGVFMLRQEGSEWKTMAQQHPVGSTFRTIAEDNDGRVWATTRNDIWRFDFRPSPPIDERFTTSDGVPLDFKNVYRFRGHVIFATMRGAMRFSESKRRFVPDPEFGDELLNGSKTLSLIGEDARKNVWISGEEINRDGSPGRGYHALLRTKSGGGFEWAPMPFTPQVEEMYALHVDQEGSCWAAAADGTLFRWQPDLARRSHSGFQVLVRDVVVEDRNVSLFRGNGNLPSQFRVPYRDNALRFDFIAPFYQDQAAVRYQYRIDGSQSERNWSPWTTDAKKDENNLSERKYKFHIRALSPLGDLSAEEVIPFQVLAPWYRTWWAYLFYTISLGLAAWLTLRWRVRILEAKNRRLEQIVEQRTIEVRNERDQNERLLLNILPAPVAIELRGTGAVTPTTFDDVTVCFTDFVGFTLSSEHLPASHLVTALNEYFTAFDEIIGRYGLEKLKTIGDSYMFVSGLPEPRSSHAVDAVLAALEMVEAVRKLSKPGSLVDWKVRVGLHTGPVVAGVVGKRKFAFDIWGNTVNFAARMESSGAPNKVNLSEVTWKRVHDFVDCEPRGGIRIKEGREMPMYFASGPQSGLVTGPVVSGIPDAFKSKYEETFHSQLKAFPELVGIVTT